MPVMTLAHKFLRVFLPAAAIATTPVAAAYGQMSPLMPKLSLGGGEQKKLTPEEQEKKQQLDEDGPFAVAHGPIDGHDGENLSRM